MSMPSKGLSLFCSEPSTALIPYLDARFPFPQSLQTHVIESVSLQVYAEDPQQLFQDISTLLGTVAIACNGVIFGRLQRNAILLLSAKFHLSRTILSKTIEFELPFDFHPKLGGRGLIVAPGDHIELVWKNHLLTIPTDVRMGAKVGWIGYPLVPPPLMEVTSQQSWRFHQDNQVKMDMKAPDVNDQQLTALTSLSLVVSSLTEPSAVEIFNSTGELVLTLDWNRNSLVVPDLTKMAASFDFTRQPLQGRNFVITVKGLPEVEVELDCICRWI